MRNAGTMAGVAAGSRRGGRSARAMGQRPRGPSPSPENRSLNPQVTVELLDIAAIAPFISIRFQHRMRFL